MFRFEGWRQGACGRRFLEFVVRGIFDSAGRLDEVQAVISDLTERTQRQQELSRALEEREALLREVHHRAKNNMQVIASLLRIQLGELRGRHVRRALEAIEYRIMSMALVHDILYRSTNVARVNLAAHLENLVTALVGLGADGGRGVTLAFDLDRTVTVEPDLAMRAGMIVSELVSNCLTHAFPHGRGGTLSLRLASRGEGGLELEVRDDGVGIAAPPSEHALGLQIVSDLVQSVRGRVTTAADEAGMSVRIELPGEVS